MSPSFLSNFTVVYSKCHTINAGVGNPGTKPDAESSPSVTAEIPAPADSLLHVCGHASYSASRQSLRWVTDAWFIVNRHPDLDWDLL